jgi:hypothetical protein
MVWERGYFCPAAAPRLAGGSPVCLDDGEPWRSSFARHLPCRTGEIANGDALSVISGNPCPASVV